VNVGGATDFPGDPRLLTLEAIERFGPLRLEVSARIRLAADLGLYGEGGRGGESQVLSPGAVAGAFRMSCARRRRPPAGNSNCLSCLSERFLGSIGILFG
jgi:hypothetical protein